MYEIEVADNQDDMTVSVERVTDIVRKALTAEQVASATISVAIVDSSTMHELNRQFLNHDYETDVLSFLLDESEPEADFESENSAPRGAGRSIDGEIIVSAAYAREMATEYDWAPEHELTLYIVHGLLHLCGYDDMTADELPVMRARECDIFRLLELPPPVRSSDDMGHVSATAASESGGTQ
jgi:probable rRNA maturation factor